ncbi:MAG TPA: type III-B CRISPR module RAMP protein Cmr4 [Thermoanaerobaculia bacterium]|nr:type III-B CRISPR module RAMP protein Cmr4 [Thermoanaerobaculia bacterium]
MTTRLTLIHAMSPLHAGTGQSVGAIDLPIARERPTGLPLIPGSSIKGALRARSLGRDKQLTKDAFGPDTENASEHSGSVQFSDAYLLLMPVRSIRGTFAWVTSPYLIRKFARGAREAGFDLADLPGSPGAKNCCVLNDTLTVTAGEHRKVVFEDLDFIVADEQKSSLQTFAEKLAGALFPNGSFDSDEWRKSLIARICLIDDDIMSLVLETATEVNAHIRLDNDTKTVAKGALWYQESLPAETVLAGIAVASQVKAVNGRSERSTKDLLDHVASLTDGLVQLGGKATVGQGSCFVRCSGGPS